MGGEGGGERGYIQFSNVCIEAKTSQCTFYLHFTVPLTFISKQ